MSKIFHNTLLGIFSILLVFNFIGCEPKAKKDDISNAPYITPNAYYAEHPEFFIFSTPSAIPKDLKWETGLNEPEFSNPNALKGGTLRLSIADFPRTTRAIGPDANTGLRSQLYDDNSMSLVEVHPNTLNYIPGLAESWAIAPDKKTVYFKLNPQAHYDDETPIRADDYLYTFYFMRSNYLQAPWYNNWYTNQFKRIFKFDDLTIAIEIAIPSPDPLFIAAIGPTPSHYYGTLTPEFPKRYQWAFPPTTGAYTLNPKDIIKGRSITLTRVNNWWAKNNRYYKGRYNVDKIIYRVVRDINKAFALFRKGDLDMIDVTLPEFWYKKTNNLEFEKGYIQRAIFYNQTPRPIGGIFLNEKAGILSDIYVREGIAYSINIDKAIEIYLHGDYKRLRTFSDGYGVYTNPHIPLVPFSPKKAEAAFARAGFTHRGPDGILENHEGQKLSFTITLMPGPQTTLYSLLQNEARQSGLDMKIETLDPLTAYGKIIHKKHQAAAFAWGNGFSHYPIDYRQSFHSANAALEASNNVTSTADPTLDQLIESYEKAEDKESIRQLAWEIQAKIAKKFVYIPTIYCPFYRLAYWRWICFPENFDVSLSASPMQYGLFWIDPVLKTETLEAKAEGKSFINEVHIYDQFSTS